jgi:hypothetical protein
MKYKVLGAKRVETVDGQEKEFFDPITVTNHKGVDSRWEKDSEITEVQVTNEVAKDLIAKGQLELIEGSFEDKE